MAEIPADFPWRPGMLSKCDGAPDVRIVNAPAIRADDAAADGVEAGAYFTGARWYDIVTSDEHPSVPDPNDPATLGALLGAVREAYASPLLHFRAGGGSWSVYRVVEDDMFGERCEILTTAGTWFRADDFDGDVGPIRAATEFSALLAAWNARPVKS